MRCAALLQGALAQGLAPRHPSRIRCAAPMRRYASKVDTNHSAVVNALRQAGCSVQSLAASGDGVPDLLVGRAGRNYLLEVKDGKRAPSEQRLTLRQLEWHRMWRGSVSVVKSPEDALKAVGLGASTYLYAVPDDEEKTVLLRPVRRPKRH